MRTPFTDRTGNLFGREPDLAYLLDRSSRPGVTVVFGRPQMGKSWLLTELGRRLSQRRDIVGHYEAMGEQADLLLHAVVDLYTRWLSDSHFSDQAKLIYSQQRGDLVARFGETFGSLFKSLSKMAGGPMESIGELVKTSFEKLAKANRDLQSGGIQIPRLPIEQGRDLLLLVQSISKSPIILILDQWEKSPGLRTESNVVENFLRHPDDWPECHIFIGSRPDPEPLTAVIRLQQAYPDLLEVYDLPPMHLEEPASSEALLTFLRSRVPIAATVPDNTLLDLVSGYAGTIYRFVSPGNLQRLKSLADLVHLAAQANSYQFDEFARLMPSLSITERTLAMRLALLPPSSVPETWIALKEFVLTDIPPRDLDTLRRNGVLEASAPPSYGHTKRTEAALRYLNKEYPVELWEACDRLTVLLGHSIRYLSSEEVSFVEALASLNSLSGIVQLPPRTIPIVRIALSLGELGAFTLSDYIAARSKLATDLTHLSPLLAIALYNCVGNSLTAKDTATRDASLDELRRLARDFPEESAIRKWLAWALYNAFFFAYAQEKEDLLRKAFFQELQQLAEDFPHEFAVIEKAGEAAVRTLEDDSSEVDFDERDRLLELLRTFVRDLPEDALVRTHLASGLMGALSNAQMNGDDRRCDNLLDELVRLAAERPHDPIFGLLAAAAANIVSMKDDQDRRNAILAGLQDLASDYPQNQMVQEHLARSLFDLQIVAKEANDLLKRDALLAQLTMSAEQNPANPKILEFLTQSLFQKRNDATDEGDRQGRDDALLALRVLKETYPEDGVVRNWFARGLILSAFEKDDEGDSISYETIWNEVSALAEAFPGDEFAKILRSAGTEPGAATEIESIPLSEQ